MPAHTDLTPVGVVSLDGHVYTMNTYTGLASQIRFDLSSGTAVPNAGTLLLVSDDNRLDEEGSPSPCFGAGLTGDESTTLATFIPGAVTISVATAQACASGARPRGKT